MGLPYHHSCLGQRVITVSSGQRIPEHCYLTISLTTIHNQLLVLCSILVALVALVALYWWH